MKRNDGFSLVELLVASLLVIILTMVGIGNWRRFQARAELGVAADQLVTQLRLVRGRATAVEKPAGCVTLNRWNLGFNAGTARLTMWADCLDAGGNSIQTGQKEEEWVLGRVTVSPATGTLYFIPLTGSRVEVSGNLTATLSSPSYSSESRRVTLSDWGDIQIEVI